MLWPKHDTHTQTRTLTSLLMLLSSTSSSEQDSSYSACLSASVHIFSLSNRAEGFFLPQNNQMISVLSHKCI